MPEPSTKTPRVSSFENPAEFIRERREALLSMDEATIRAYAQKYGGKMPADPAVFWAGVHKARTALKDLPMNARHQSACWLRSKGMRPENEPDDPIYDPLLPPPGKESEARR